MADYDSGEVTARERKAAQNQTAIGKYNAESTLNQLSQQLGNYDFANRQNRALADLQLKQNSRKTSADRFDAMRDLQAATLGLTGSMGQAMFGSSVGNLMRMLESRSDKDNQTYWTQHQVNQDSVNNAYEESVNQNNAAKNDAAIGAEKALRDMQADQAANLNNINPNLFVAPGTGDADLGASGVYEKNKVAENNAKISGYLMPDVAEQAARASNPRNKVAGNDYFGQLLNRFNGRR